MTPEPGQFRVPKIGVPFAGRHAFDRAFREPGGCHVRVLPCLLALVRKHVVSTVRGNFKKAEERSAVNLLFLFRKWNEPEFIGMAELCSP